MLEAQKGMNLSDERGHRKPSWDASAVMGPMMRAEARAVGTQEWRLGAGGRAHSQDWTGSDG